MDKLWNGHPIRDTDMSYLLSPVELCLFYSGESIGIDLPRGRRMYYT